MSDDVMPATGVGVAGAGRLLLRVSFAIGDQALFAGTSFAFTLLLGRWTVQQEFGTFSVAFSVFVLVQNVFEGFVFEPLGVFGAGRLAHQLDAYVGRLLVGHLAIAGVLAGVVAAIALVADALHQPELATAFFGMAVATPFLLARILTRQPLYITGRIHWSMLTGAIFLMLSVSILSCLHILHALTSFSAFLALGAGSGVASAFVIIFLLNGVWRSKDPALSPRRLVADHFAYGRWAVSERLLLWLQGNLLFLELPIVAGLHAGAAYRALMTITMPAYMGVSAMAGALLPMLARTSEPPRWGRMLMPTTIVLMLIYGVLIVTVGQQAGHLAFAGRYDENLTKSVLVVTSVGSVLFGICVVLEVQLRARLMIRRVLFARVVATAAIIVVGIPITARFGVIGAAASIAIVWLVTAISHLVMRRSRL